MATSSIASVINSKTRVTGMASGLDTDAIIKSILAADRAKADKLAQKKQLVEWKRDSYREISTALKSFNDEYFNSAKATTNMKNSSSFSAYTTGYTKLTADTVGVTSGDGASTGKHSINVTQLATQAQIVTGKLTEDVAGSVALTSPINLSGKTLSLTVDGTTKTINLADYADANSLKQGLQTSINSAFGAGKVTLSLSSGTTGQLKFATSEGSTMSMSADDSVYAGIGFTANDSKTNRISLSSSLSTVAKFFKTELNVADPNAKVSFNINGKTIDVGYKYSEATIQDVISAVNKSDAGVEMKYSSLTDTFTLKNKEFGATNALSVTDNGGVLASLGITSGTATAAKDAVFDLDGITGMARNSNAFTIEGNSYTLKQLGNVEFNVDKDVSGMITKIKGFVTKYNEVLDKINTKYGESYNKTYQPLTDSQKESLEAATIDKWEAKAKVGLLSKDSSLSSITSSMRGALLESVGGVGLTLSDIGISSSSYTDEGKLTVNETKLKEALENNYSDVMTMFTKESSVRYSETLTNDTKRATRRSENGIANRLSDILQDNIRTTYGKGSLLTKAGMVGDGSEYTNDMTKDMTAKATLISTMLDKIDSKEAKLYSKYATLEKAMNKMQSQSSWLSSK